MRLAPGGPFDMERALPAAVRTSIEARYHLNESLARQYLRYLGDVVRGDLGPSFRYPDRTVNELLALGFPVSMTLGACALALALVVGGTAGVVAAIRHNRWVDYLTMSIALGGVSVPNFVLGPLLILVFALWLGWLPVAGWGTWRHLVLPSVTLAAFYTAYVARLARAGMLEVILQDWVRTARAKGLREAVVVTRHALPGALLPVVSYLGPAAARAHGVGGDRDDLRDSGHRPLLHPECTQSRLHDGPRHRRLLQRAPHRVQPGRGLSLRLPGSPGDVLTRCAQPWRPPSRRCSRFLGPGRTSVRGARRRKPGAGSGETVSPCSGRCC